MLNIDDESKRKIIALIEALVPSAKVLLFGSRARGDFSEWSDVDLALDAGNRLPIKSVDEIVSVLKETNIPYKVDVVDYHQVSHEMRDSIDNEGIVWKS